MNKVLCRGGGVGLKVTNSAYQLMIGRSIYKCFLITQNLPFKILLHTNFLQKNWAPSLFSSIFSMIFRRIEEISSPIFRRFCRFQRNLVSVDVI